VYVFDIEANGLYFDGDTWHCGYIFDVATGDRWGFRPHEFLAFIKKLEEADVVVGHNVIDYDLPFLKKVHPELKDFQVLDTLCLSRFLEPDLLGGHSLKVWGERLGDAKGSYSEDTENAWDAFSEEMFDYCEQDVSLTLNLYKHLCNMAGFDELNPPTIHWIDV
ncbi:UNVERIFIED_CONTAM: hypothetical protein RF648_21795, partial [Kocuria sp. CPCC 205274]